ncbi:MAG: AbrB/MazE/SpoVT family DNA-binding domain-containing protein [Deltaproteobacteria bacterium]|nr:AbrB/MazE/SpoVT family DNA-binding domain-containing protein [Deltaproteobacteria bacterium]
MVVKITSKGQTTIPKEIRDMLKSSIIEFDVVEGNIVIRPVKSIAGSLNKYSKKYISLKDVREPVWEEVARERAGKKTS